MNEYQSNNTDKLIDTFNKIPYGSGWELLIKEFTGEINKLKRAGYGVVLISHTKNKQFEKDTESAHSKTVPDLSDKERNMINAMADFMLLGEFEIEIIEPAELDGDGKVVKNAVVETKRVLYLRTNEQAEAGFRWEDCPEKIPMDFELFQKVFKKALLKEIEKGKEKYNLDDSKINKIREDLDKLEKEQRERTIKQEQEKEQREQEEKEKEILKETIKKILLLSKELLDNKKCTKEEIVEVLKGNPTKIKDISEAESILDNLKKL